MRPLENHHIPYHLTGTPLPTIRRTLNSSLHYVHLHKPSIVIMEIVKQVFCKPSDGGSSVYQVLEQRMQADGYCVISSTLGASDYGAPQRRERVWIVGFLTPHGLARPETPPPWAIAFRDVLLSLRTPMLGLYKFLLPLETAKERWRSDPRFRARIQSLKRPKTDKDEELYKVTHLEAYSAAGYTWPPTFPPEFVEALGFLPQRAQECAFFYCEKHKDSTEETVHDLNLNLTWGSEAVDQCVCICSSSIIFIRSKMRILLGEEALAIQGLSHCIQRPLSPPLTQKDLLEMAGNAFSGFVGMAVLLTIFTVYPFSSEHFRCPRQVAVDSVAPSLAPEESQAAEVSDNDMDDVDSDLGV